jgi:hypothetical protein
MMSSRSFAKIIIVITKDESMRALMLFLAMPLASAVDLQWSAPPMATILSGKVAAIESREDTLLLDVDGQKVSVSALPRFVDAAQWQSCQFEGVRRRSPAGAAFAANLACEQGGQVAFGVNLPPDRILKTSLNLRAVDGQIRVQSGERVLLTLKSGQSGSVRVDGALWCVNATFTPAPRLQGVDAERVDRLSWVLMRTSTARLCRK